MLELQIEEQVSPCFKIVEVVKRCGILLVTSLSCQEEIGTQLTASPASFDSSSGPINFARNSGEQSVVEHDHSLRNGVFAGGGNVHFAGGIISVIVIVCLCLRSWRTQQRDATNRNQDGCHRETCR